MGLTLNDYQGFHHKQAGYQISDQDVKSTDADINYYGFLNQEGEWYIMEEDTSVGGDDDLMAWRFIKGGSDYTTNWTAREALSYADFETTFK